MNGPYEKTRMQIIREGLRVEHQPGSLDSDFVDAIYGLLDEYSRQYRDEFDRLDDNERIYNGDHWAKSPYTSERGENPNEPKPTMPIIASTIENIKADMIDDVPEVMLTPDWAAVDVSAKVLTRVANQQLKENHFTKDWSLSVHDALVGGWFVWETGYDPDICNGRGGAFIRYQVNKNMLFDPEAPNIQDGRGVFKLSRKPKDWFLQRFPEQAAFMVDDTDIPAEHDRYNDSTVPQQNDGRYRLIEFWVREYDPETGRYMVHFVQLAGRQVLFCSASTHPDGYYAHGLYPFVVVPLFPRKGSPLGYGIVDLFKDAQRYCDKLDQLILINSFLAGRNRMLVSRNAGVDKAEVTDWSKDVIDGDQVSDAFIRWMPTAPLPAYVFNYVAATRQSIKQESGANDQSRGQTGNSVTAASAITKLQEMSTKRSRMETVIMHEAFQTAMSMVLEVMREFDSTPRRVPITVGGVVYEYLYSRKTIKLVSVNGKEATGDDLKSIVGVSVENNLEKEYPIGYYVDVKSAVQTTYQKMEANEVLLTFMKTLQGNVDPVIMLEAFEMDNIEQILDTVRRAQNGGMVKLQRDLAQAVETIKQQSSMIAEYQKAMASAQEAVREVTASRQAAQSDQKKAISQGQAMAKRTAGKQNA